MIHEIGEKKNCKIVKKADLLHVLPMGRLVDYNVSYQCWNAIMSICNKIVISINYVMAERKGGCSGLMVTLLVSG